MDTLILTPASVEAAAIHRLMHLATRFGIASSQVMDSLNHWGHILDEVKAKA